MIVELDEEDMKRRSPEEIQTIGRALVHTIVHGGKYSPRVQLRHLGCYLRLQPLVESVRECWHYSNRFIEDKSKTIWFCWFQGMDLAPLVVRACYESLERQVAQLDGWSIVMLTEKNIGDYVTFPDHIVNLVNNGIIDMIKLSDILRLELLTKYGGLWYDATLLCLNKNIFTVLESSKMLLPNNYDPSLGQARTHDSWFIFSRGENEPLTFLLDLHYEYWKRYSKPIDYLIFHLLWSHVADYYEDDVAAMPQMSANSSMFLYYSGLIWKDADNVLIDSVAIEASVIKLSYKYDHSISELIHSNFGLLLKRYSPTTYEEMQLRSRVLE